MTRQKAAPLATSKTFPRAKGLPAFATVAHENHLLP